MQGPGTVEDPPAVDPAPAGGVEAVPPVSRLREGSLAVIPDCGHMLQVECPDTFLAALEDFLGERGRR